MDLLAFDPAPPARLKAPRMDIGSAQARSLGPLELVLVPPGASVLSSLTPKALVEPVGMVLPSGPATFSQGGQNIALQSGDWTLVRGGASLEADAMAPVKAIIIPAEWLADRGVAFRQGLFRRFPDCEPINRMAYTVFGALFDQASALGGGEAADLAQMALHVLKNALARAGAHRPSTSVLAGRVRELIDWRLRDPALRVEQIARALRCTPRHIHRAFENEPETVGQYILRRRLEGCRDDLADPVLTGRSVTEIAFSWGFNNAAHFSRAFKRQFGCCPRTCRAFASPGRRLRA